MRLSGLGGGVDGLSMRLATTTNRAFRAPLVATSAALLAALVCWVAAPAGSAASAAPAPAPLASPAPLAAPAAPAPPAAPAAPTAPSDPTLAAPSVPTPAAPAAPTAPTPAAPAAPAFPAAQTVRSPAAPAAPAAPTSAAPAAPTPVAPAPVAPAPAAPAPAAPAAPVAAAPRAGSLAAITARPLTNIAPTPAFAAACYAETSPTCNTLALAAINTAHSAEGLPPMALPADYNTLTVIDQLLAVTNLERASRHLPAFAGPNPNLDTLALAAAQATTDPTGPPDTTWASNWAYGYATPLAADYVWMYDDGIGSSNIDCTPTNQTGCWGHRQNILVTWAGTMGAATTTTGGANSLTELFVAN
jgi:hypothetical protein